MASRNDDEGASQGFFIEVRPGNSLVAETDRYLILDKAQLRILDTSELAISIFAHQGATFEEICLFLNLDQFQAKKAKAVLLSPHRVWRFDPISDKALDLIDDEQDDKG